MSQVVWWTVVVAVASILRLLVVWGLAAELEHDRDSYLALGRRVAEGRGYTDPAGQPTAYRPPLYPLLIATIHSIGGGRTALAAVHVLLGTATAALTLVAACRLGFARRAAVCAGLLVAADPLLLVSAAQPMTETLATFLAAVVIVLAAGAGGGNSPQREQGSTRGADDSQPSRLAESAGSNASALRPLLLGLALGGLVLTRPAFWLFVLAWAAVWTASNGWRWLRQSAPLRVAAKRAALLTAGFAVAVAPWAIRNWLAFGTPILTTTHGGYTLLLANNPVFYREVVAQPWGAVWEGRSLARWQAALEDEMRAVNPPVIGEVARDRWMSRRAWEFIASHPGSFAQAASLRLRRFWNVAPLGDAASAAGELWKRLANAADLPERRAAGDAVAAVVRAGVATFYGIVFFGAIAGLVVLARTKPPGWAVPILMIVCLAAVHAVYWSNARMRAPLVPAIALVSVRGFAALTAAVRARRKQKGEI
ncbi:MAG: hypothetical protein KY476_19515 [Planctomycetes bacterium]|nr:hypothetical protein [Planctomycetota bacterium]